MGRCQPRRSPTANRLVAAVRLVHPAPAAAVVALTVALAAILTAQSGRPPGLRLLLTVLSVAGSQIATGAFNDLADRHRDARVRPEKPIPAGELGPRAAALIGLGGLALHAASSAALGGLALVLGATATGSALLYDFALSRRPASVVPYLVSFGILPAWIAAGIEVPLSRVLPAMLLVAPFAAAAHLANALRDFEVDRAGGSRSLVQVLGRGRSRAAALALALGVGVAVGVAFSLGGQLRPLPLALGALGLAAVAQGAWSARRLWYGMLLAAVCWTAGWALATGGL